MIKYIKKQDGLQTEFEFFAANDLPKDIPISAPITFAFIGQNLVIVQKQNAWWDVPGGKIEKDESWVDALKREANEEAGIIIDNIRIVGYIMAKNTGKLNSSVHPKVNILPVTVSFVRSVNYNWNKKETINRDAPARDEVKELFKLRKDSGQLLEIFDYVIDDFDSQNYEYTFEYFSDNKIANELPNTQAVVFIKAENNKFVLIGEPDNLTLSLPGGGCHMDETGINCAIRESLEEAQIDIKNVKLLGTVIVRVLKKGKVLSESTQKRYTAEIGNIQEFIPNKNGFETISRKFVDFESLKDEAEILKNPTGDEIICDLKKHL